jgi:Ca2+-binding EF-hand superfamily protein
MMTMTNPLSFQQYETNPEEGASKVFAMLDTDKDGLITSQDLERAIVEFGNVPFILRPHAHSPLLRFCS